MGESSSDEEAAENAKLVEALLALTPKRREAVLAAVAVAVAASESPHIGSGASSTSVTEKKSRIKKLLSLPVQALWPLANAGTSGTVSSTTTTPTTTTPTTLASTASTPLQVPAAQAVLTGDSQVRRVQQHLLLAEPPPLDTSSRRDRDVEDIEAGFVRRHVLDAEQRSKMEALGPSPRPRSLADPLDDVESSHQLSRETPARRRPSSSFISEDRPDNSSGSFSYISSLDDTRAIKPLSQRMLAAYSNNGPFQSESTPMMPQLPIPEKVKIPASFIPGHKRSRSVPTAGDGDNNGNTSSTGATGSDKQHTEANMSSHAVANLPRRRTSFLDGEFEDNLNADTKDEDDSGKQSLRTTVKAFLAKLRETEVCRMIVELDQQDLTDQHCLALVALRDNTEEMGLFVIDTPPPLRPVKPVESTDSQEMKLVATTPENPLLNVLELAPANKIHFLNDAEALRTLTDTEVTVKDPPIADDTYIEPGKEQAPPHDETLPSTETTQLDTLCSPTSSSKPDTKIAFVADVDVTIAVVLPVTSHMSVELLGNGSFSVSLTNQNRSRSYVFKTISVRSMWSTVAAIRESIRLAVRRELATPAGETARSLQWLDYYRKIAEHSKSRHRTSFGLDAYPNSRHKRRSVSPDSRFPAGRPSIDRVSGPSPAEIVDQLSIFMQEVDLDNVSSRQMRDALENHFGVNLAYCKQFIDEEMLVLMGQMEAPSKIFDYLYLGSEWNASNKTELDRNGVGFVLNMAVEIVDFYPDHYRYLHVLIHDEPSEDILKYFDATYRFIKAARESGSVAFVHCKMGVSRSATAVIAFSMKENGWSLEQALAHVKKRRPIASPNKGFLNQLQEYEGILRASRNYEMFASGSSNTTSAPKLQTPPAVRRAAARAESDRLPNHLKPDSALSKIRARAVEAETIVMKIENVTGDESSSV